MLAEREHLFPLATEGFDLAALHFPHVNQSGCVKVLTNFYSTPLPVGTRVEPPRSTRLTWRSGTMGIAWRGMNAATSAINRCWNWSIIWMCSRGSRGHWPDPRLWNSAGHKAAGRPVMTASGPESANGMAARTGTRAMIEVLLLSRTYGAGPRSPGGGRSAGDGHFQPERDPLSAQRGLPASNGRSAAVEVGELRRYDRPQPSMEAYEQLRPNWTEPPQTDSSSRIADWPVATEVVQ